MSDNENTPFKDIVEGHKTRVFNTIIGFVHNIEDAEDVTQEVFVEVYRSLNSFNRQSSLSTWIYRIAVNKSLDFLRKKNRKKRFGFIYSLLDKDGSRQYDQPHFEHPGVLMENKEKSSILFLAIEQLSEKQKTAFVLFHLEELSQKEIAEIMNISPKAVESLIQRAKATLRVKLGKLYKNQGI